MNLRILIFTLILSFGAQAQTKLISKLEGNFSGNQMIGIQLGENMGNLYYGENYEFVETDSSPSPKTLSINYILTSGKIRASKTFWMESGEYTLSGNVNQPESWQLSPVHPFTQIQSDIELADDQNKKSLISSHLDKLVGLRMLNSNKSLFDDEELMILLNQVPSHLADTWEVDEIKTYLSLNTMARAKVGQLAPDFVLESKSGEDFRLKEKKGKYVLLDFSFTGCGGCIKALPELIEVYQKYGNEVEFVTIWNDKSRNIWEEKWKDHKALMTWTNLWDRTSLATRLFEIEIFPSFVLINPSGEVQSIWNGYSKGKLKRKLEKELKGFSE
ncbi:TlpA family protein disulfide reductase [Algoriphagus marincola]|uniref:TlpA family protein disulfide reductase n=1 Tax=Algoriphagus marincola TaxID=264027 RepID=A0ABS7N5U0_9BACT|nr:TlpA disulfide reductase family protein [Algoriphagus marincola]MBY5951707.1 TlpA family protein disulfide reductase [Algoriphagus marincola]